MSLDNKELICPPAILDGEMEGEFSKPFVTFRDAIDYLQRYSLGTIEHPDMNLLSFIYVRKDGALAFADVVETRSRGLSTTNLTDALLTPEELAEFEDATIWDQSRFVYMPSSEMGCRTGGLAWFDELRSQSSSPTLNR